MKKKLVLFSALFTLLAFAAVTGCKRDDNDYYFYGDVTFWNNNGNLSSNIIVTVDGSQTGVIRTFRAPSYCNEVDFANFYLSEGSHYYSARTEDGYYLGSDNFYVNGSCKIIYIP